MTGRDEAVEAVLRILVPYVAADWGSEPETEAANLILDALLSPRTVPCETCGGANRAAVIDATGQRVYAERGPCPDCVNGIQTLASLVVLRDECKLVEYVKVESFQATPPRAEMTRRAMEPLYRLPSGCETCGGTRWVKDDPTDESDDASMSGCSACLPVSPQEKP